jgi:hypothetical protein
LLLDEVHHLSDWAARLKGQWDLVPAPAATASKGAGVEGVCTCCDGEALCRCNTGLLVSSFFVLVKEREDKQLAMKKRRVFLQTAKPDQVDCFQSVTRKKNESRAKLSGNFTNVQTGTLLYAQQNAAITSDRRMAVNVHIKAACQAAQARKRRKK